MIIVKIINYEACFTQIKNLIVICIRTICPCKLTTKLFNASITSGRK